MAKVVKAVAIGALIVGAAFVTGGVSIGPSLGALTAGAGVTIAGATITATALGSVMLLTAATTVIGGIASQIQGTPPVGAAQLSRLTPSLQAAAYRKLAFGQTAFATDIRYMEPSGTDQEYVDYIVACASHAVESIDEIWFDGRRAWTSGGGVQSFFSGYLTVNVRTEGTAANAITINSGTVWNSSCRLTGCAYVHFRIKRTGNDKKAESPLPSGLPSGVVIIGKGMRVYDPRRDSTAGGSGSHRANDQSTWQFTDGSTVLGTNPALQALAYNLGWKINGKLAVGKGIPPGRLDLASFAASANLCDEAVNLAGGGAQRRYESGGIFSEGDGFSRVLDTMCLACGGEITDSDGRIGMVVAHNDLAGAIVTLTEDDVVGEYSYEPAPPLNETINVVRGRYVDASTNGLYQLADVPEVSIASPDGVTRAAPVELAMVQEVRRAQRIFKQLLQKAQYPGLFAAQFGPRALQVKRSQVLKLNFWPLGFSLKLFRVVQQTIDMNSGVVTMILREENAATYAWDRDERAGVVAAAPVLFDPRKNPLAITQGTDIGVENGADVTANNEAAMTLPAAPVFNADFTGTITTTMPRVVRCYRFRGSSDVSSSTTWSVTPTGCSATIDSTGSISISAVTATGKIVVTSVRDGKTLTDEFAVIKNTAAPPVSGGGGGGGGGGGTASDTTIASTSSTSYGGANAGPMTVTAQAGGVVSLSAPLTFSTSGSGGSAAGKWQWRVVGGSWADVASEIGSATPAVTSEPESGYIEVNQSKTGLTSGTDYEFQLLLRRSGGSGTFSFSGTASAVAS
jgi:hypothetical protein